MVWFSKQIIRILVVGLLLLLTTTCSRTHMEGEEVRLRFGTIFRHRWWNYYTRALDNADRQAYVAARMDLMAAMSKSDRDRRMARTYGMHFINYFPHRELGIIYMRTGDLAEAQKELEKSISQYPSAKAHYYLDRVRRQRIEATGAKIDPPAMNISAPEGDHWTRHSTVRISGRAHDPNYISAITIGGEPLFIDGSTQQWEFDHAVDLSQGRHIIDVTASNLAGLATTQVVTIHVDRQGPWVVVEKISAENDETQLEGMLFDKAGVQSMSINGEQASIATGRRVSFCHKVRADAETFVFTASDRLGNITRIPIQRQQIKSLGALPPLLAVNASDTKIYALFRSRDRKPPIIRLTDWDDAQEVYMDEAVLCGSVRDRDKVTRLTINGEEVLPHSGAMVLFSHFLALDVGSNPVVMIAEDGSGNQTVKRIRIDRKVPKARLLSQRMSLSVFAFKRQNGIPDTSFAFQDNFIHQLMKQNRFQLIEREMLESILQEQKISRTKLIDRSTAVRVGRLAAAQAIVSGSMVESLTGIDVISHVIDAETSEILATVDAYGEDKSMIGLKYLAKALALKTHREFPLVNGMVVDKNKDMIFTDIGSNDLRAQRHIIVYQEQPVRHATTGRHMGEDLQILGKARIVQSNPGFSKAELQPGCSPEIQTQHQVITQ